MTIHCIHCGTMLPDHAKFCLICGKSLKGPASPPVHPVPKVEYLEISLDISHPQLKYTDHLSSFFVRKEDERDAKIEARQRVYRALQPYLNQGWMLDGPFEAAVEMIWHESRGLTWTYRLERALVKLRRPR